MGIGLNLCRSIVESHQGRIRAENLYNGATVIGCRFSFTLPVETSNAGLIGNRSVEPAPKIASGELRPSATQPQNA